MEYPKINLSLEALRAREGESMQGVDLKEFDFEVESYEPGSGGRGHFHGGNQSVSFGDIDELCDIVINQSDLSPEEFYYQDAMSTCDEIEHELREDGMKCTWKDQLIVSQFTGRHPARARVCYYQPPGSDEHKAVAVLRDGTTIAHFRPLQSR